MIRWHHESLPPDAELVAWAEAQLTDTGATRLPYICRLLKLWQHWPNKVVHVPAAQPELDWLMKQDQPVACQLRRYAGSRLSDRPVNNPCGEIVLPSCGEITLNEVGEAGEHHG